LLLIHPPLAKPCEPPAGIAKLAGVLKSHRYPCTLLDANLEGIHYLLSATRPGNDTWSQQAFRNLPKNLDALRSPELYNNVDRYRRTAMDLGRVLSQAGKEYGVTLSPANYEDNSLSPLRSADLLHAAENPEKSPFFRWFCHRLIPLVEKENPAVFGFSLNYLSQALTTFAMIGFLKDRFPKIPVIIGGGLATSWKRRPNWHNFFAGLVEMIVDGPGEAPLLSFLEIEEKPFQSLPDYTQLRKNPYLSPGFVLPYAASSGCWWNRCAFCPEPAEKTAFHALPPKQAEEEIDCLASATTPSLLHLLDNAITPAFLETMATRSRFLPWYGFARIGTHLEDPEFCRALRRSGCVMLKLGIESGDPKVLEKMGKGIDPDASSRALKTLRSAGIATYVYLLFGTPGESLEEARKTLEFTRRHADSITFLNLAIFNLPATSAASSGLTTRPFNAGDLSLYQDFDHPSGWSRRKVRLFLEREFKRDSAVRPILRRDPPFFTSNHAPFLQIGGRFFSV